VAEKLFQEIPSDKRKIDPCDKVKEFIGHQELSEKLGVDFYFATPDHSWERGLNEPTNGLSSDGSKSLILRLAESPPPRKWESWGESCFLHKSLISTGNLNYEKLNNRPRKYLDYPSPNEVCSNSPDSDAIQT
jgi:IS30 family transposase